MQQMMAVPCISAQPLHNEKPGQNSKGWRS